MTATSNHTPLPPSAHAVRKVMARLEGLPDLTPSAAATSAFNCLVGMARRRVPTAVAADIVSTLSQTGELSRLHTLCARGEAGLEHAWSTRLNTSANPSALLATFPYMAEYRTLVAQEVALLRKTFPSAQRVLFVGSGPLPLSPWLMSARHGLTVDMLDKDASAHHCALPWLQKLPGHQNLRCLHADILHMNNFSAFHAVFLGAMVGTTQDEKRTILSHLHTAMLPGQPLLARSAKGLRQLLYPQLPAAAGFRLAGSTRAGGKVINSTLLLIRV
ncbi:MAG: hypothetical protein GC129_05580 [Proteobacteria bacterium]|nr:hypothetical protein [Pseudomonadota bacterium]